MPPTPVGVLPPDGSKKRWSYPAKPQTLASLARGIQTTANSNDLLERRPLLADRNHGIQGMSAQEHSIPYGPGAYRSNALRSTPVPATARGTVRDAAARGALRRTGLARGG